jgi:hypothetical protein
MSPLDGWWITWCKNLPLVTGAIESLTEERGSDVLLQRVRGGTAEEKARGLLNAMQKWDASAKGLYAMLNLSAAALGLRYILTRPGTTGICSTESFVQYLIGLNHDAVQ